MMMVRSPTHEEEVRTISGGEEKLSTHQQLRLHSLRYPASAKNVSNETLGPLESRMAYEIVYTYHQLYEAKEAQGCSRIKHLSYLESST